jgi:hypothetical protein
MITFYVGSLAYYVLVDAPSEVEARRLALPLLHELYAEIRQRLGRDAPINITTVRPVTDDEIELQRFHDEAVARECELQGQ